MRKAYNLLPSVPQTEDSARGCRTRGHADLLAATVLGPGNERGRMEGSARSWFARADMLDDEERTAPTRRAHLRAEWEDGEDEMVGGASPPRRSDSSL
jgi:hypothetical protein